MKKIFFIILTVILFLSSSIHADVKNATVVTPFFTPETNFGLALTNILYFKKSKEKFYSSLKTSLLYTERHQFMVGINPQLYFDGTNYLLKAKLNYTNFEKNFYGIGNNTSDDDRQDYIDESHEIGLSFSKKLSKEVRLAVQYDFQNLTMQNINSDGQLITDGILSAIGTGLNFDTRNSYTYPTNGYKLDLSYLLYNKSFGSNYNYSCVSLDFRNYIDIYKKKIIFSYQFYSEFINGKAPIQSLASLGGQNLLRGFYSDRYIDNIVIALQPEFKFRITSVLYVALFTGIGNVYNNLEAVDLKKLKMASGAGIRIKIKSNPKVNFRIDFAMSNESKGIYFTVLEAF